MNFLKKLFSSKKRNPFNEDAALLSQQLKQNQNDLLFSEVLRPIKLDYELMSLKELDYYLLKVRLYFQIKNQDAKSMTEKGILMSELTPTILSVGAYLGETLRKQNKKLNWTENTQQLHSGTTAPSFAALVLTNQVHTISPMQEIINFICNAQQPNSLYQYAEEILSR